MNISRISYSVCITAFLFAVFHPAWAEDIETGKHMYENAQYTEAFHILKPLAESGDLDAQHLVGMMYANGNGIEKNEGVAVAWYSKAAHNGNSDAQLALADMYLNGRGVPKDESLAQYWQWRAADSFMVTAKQNLLAEYKATDDQLNQANKKQEATSENQASNTRTPAAKKECSQPPYPDEARKSNQTGTVALLFLLDKDGSVLDLAVVRSSGWPILDQASVKGLRSCTFVPAMVDGHAIQSIFGMSHTWKINGR